MLEYLEVHHGHILLQWDLILSNVLHQFLLLIQQNSE